MTAHDAVAENAAAAVLEESESDVMSVMLRESAVGKPMDAATAFDAIDVVAQAFEVRESSHGMLHTAFELCFEINLRTSVMSVLSIHPLKQKKVRLLRFECTWPCSLPPPPSPLPLSLSSVVGAYTTCEGVEVV
jgi:hypothetical protein